MQTRHANAGGRGDAAARGTRDARGAEARNEFDTRNRWYSRSMTEKPGRGRPPSELPEDPVTGDDLKQKRDAFLHTFFRRGAELTDELVHENKRLHDEMTLLEEENAALKTQLASDRAIRDLLDKIESLEREKQRLLSSVHEHEQIT